MWRGLSILLSLIFPAVSFCEEQFTGIDLEPIVVEKQNRKGSGPYSADVFSFIDSDSYYFASCEDILDYSSSVDLRKRALFTQQDLSIRGSGFEDNKVFLNGIELNDPQTGHFSLEMPFPSCDIEEAALRKNSQSVRFVLKKPEESGGTLQTLFGEHALFEELLSVSFPFSDVKSRISLEHKISSGAVQDTDFEIYKMGFTSSYQTEDLDAEFIYGLLNKDFGAGGFYAAPFFVQEEECIRQNFFSLRTLIKKEYLNIEISPFFRKHDDKFILNRHDPAFYTNYHTTYINGFNSQIDFKGTCLFLGFGLRREKIDSSNLGNHKRQRESLALGVKPIRVGSFELEALLGADYYSSLQWQDSLSLILSYFLYEDFRVKLSFDRIHRIPSFTELYYNSPSNIGNPALDLQNMDNFEWGVAYSNERCKWDYSLFLRKQRNTIDWFRNSSVNPWRAYNVGSVEARGIETGYDFYLKDSLLSNIHFGYTFLELDNKSSFSYSKYVFNYLRHKAIIAPAFLINSDLSAGVAFIFERPASDSSRVICNFSLDYRISDSLSFSFEGQNLFNQEYEELEGVRANPRWLKAGFAYKF